MSEDRRPHDDPTNTDGESTPGNDSTPGKRIGDFDLRGQRGCPATRGPTLQGGGR